MAILLVIEDNMTMREGIVQILSRNNHEVYAGSSGHEGLILFHQYSPDFVITDLKMEDMDGITVLKKVKEVNPDTLVMIITAFGTVETAVEAMKLGAYDFITKPFPPDLLRVKVANALHFTKLRTENQFLRSETQREHGMQMIGTSSAIRSIQDQIGKAAVSDVTVFITGESGTGKELVARALHVQSKRAHKPLIKVDCSALAEGVLESELFGHERGAFTGAIQRKLGRFELADGGTIFLDEIGEISSSIQLKLLRVLQDRCFERVGGTRTIHSDVRVISATNKKIHQEVQQGRFREDLFYRLHIVPIHMPPLRERSSDIPLLVEHFCSVIGARNNRKVVVTPQAMNLLSSYPWPGNIRELENLLERTIVLTPSGQIDISALPEELKKTGHHVDLEDILAHPGKISLQSALESLEKRLLLQAHEKTGGVKTRMAELLGIKTSALYYKLEKYGIS